MARSAPGERPAPASPSASTPAIAGGAQPAASFEELMKKLEGIVTRLERGELSLEDSLQAYEEGIGLVRDAQGRLDGMDKRLEELMADGRTAPLQTGAMPSSRRSPASAASDAGDAADG